MTIIIAISTVGIIVYFIVRGGGRQSDAVYSSATEDKVELLQTERPGFAGVRNHRSPVRLKTADELEKLIPQEAPNFNNNIENKRRFETPEKFRNFIKRDMVRREKVGNLVLSKLDFTEIEKIAVQKRNEQIQELYHNIMSQLDSGAMVVDLKKQIGNRSEEINNRLEAFLGKNKYMLFLTEFAQQYRLQKP